LFFCLFVLICLFIIEHHSTATIMIVGAVSMAFFIIFIMLRQSKKNFLLFIINSLLLSIFLRTSNLIFITLQSFFLLDFFSLDFFLITLVGEDEGDKAVVDLGHGLNNGIQGESTGLLDVLPRLELVHTWAALAFLLGDNTLEALRSSAGVALVIALATEKIVRITSSVLAEVEQRLEFLTGEVLLRILLHIDDVGGQPFLGDLALVDLFFDGARAEEAVEEALLLLTISPDTAHGLGVVGGVPVRIEQNEAVGADEVQADTTSLGGEEEDDFTLGGNIEAVDEFLALLNRSGTIKLEVGNVLLFTQLGEDMESLRVVGDDDELVAVLGELIKHQGCEFDLGTECTINISSSVALGEDGGRELELGSLTLDGFMKEIDVIAELLKGGDEDERSRGELFRESVDSLVDGFLFDTEAAEDDHINLGRKILLIDGGGTTKNELLSHLGEEVGTIGAEFTNFIISIGFTTTHNRFLVDTGEEVDISENTRIDEADHGVELTEIVLDRGTREDNATASGHHVDSASGLDFSILQTVSFIAHDEIDGAHDLEAIDVLAELIIGNDKNITFAFEARESTITLRRRFRDAEDLDGALTKPLGELLAPVGTQG